MLGRVLPVLMPVLSALIVVFGLGVFIAEYKVWPYRPIASGAKTLLVAYDTLRAPPYIGQFGRRVIDLPAGDAPAARFTPGPDAADYPGTLLLVGGLNEYRELCPEMGCVAVEIDREGEVLRSWPFRPDEIFAADMTGGALEREAVPAKPEQIFRPLGAGLYDNGDILVTFQSTGAMFPFAAGAARIAADGTPVWYRFDYTHHWPTLLDDGRTVVPDLEVATGDWIVPVGPNGRTERLVCATGRPQVDGFHILSPEGEVETRFDVAAALLDSPWAPLLIETYDPCDPLHINYVDVLDDTAPGGAFKPGNYLISLRNLSAMAVLDPDTGDITDLRRGSFSQQHSVQQLEGTRVLMFDNWGGDAMGGGSRLLEVDLATGTERRVFPRPSAPEFEQQLFSDRGSQLDISADRQRALVAFSGEGAGFEVDLGTGRAILRYDSLHDLRGVKGALPDHEEKAGRAQLYGMYYANGG